MTAAVDDVVEHVACRTNAGDEMMYMNMRDNDNSHVDEDQKASLHGRRGSLPIGRAALDRESSCLNNLARVMRSHEQGNIHFDSAHRLVTLEHHNRKRMLSLFSREMDYNEGNGEDSEHHLHGRHEESFNEMLESAVIVKHGGSIDDFWMRYRNGDIVVASKFRNTSDGSFKTIHAYAIPHMFPCTRRDADGVNDGEATTTAAYGHVVLFVCYPKMNPPRIVMYDPNYDRDEERVVQRCDEYALAVAYNRAFRQEQNSVWPAQRMSFDVECETRGRAHVAVMRQPSRTTFAQQMAFHALENFMHALEFVDHGFVTGCDTHKRVKMPKSKQHGKFMPSAYRFCVHGYGLHSTDADYSLSSGLIACAGMRDILMNWHCAHNRQHVMSFAGGERRRSWHSVVESLSERVFDTPCMSTVDYTAYVVSNMICRFLLCRRTVKEPKSGCIREISPSTVMAFGRSTMREYVEALDKFYKLGYKNIFSSSTQDNCIGVQWEDFTDVHSGKSIDVLVRFVDCEPSRRNVDDTYERDVYEKLSKLLPYVRYMITVTPYMSISVNYKKCVDMRLHVPKPDYALLYRLHADTQRMLRSSDRDTTYATLYSTFPPHLVSRRGAFSVELPACGNVVQWITGLGWLPLSGDDCDYERR